MSDITGVARYIQVEGTQARSPISESLLQAMGGSINYLLNNLTGYQQFLSSGSFTTAAGVTRLYLIGCGGGGGGANDAGASGGGGGGGGAPLGTLIIPVTPLTLYSVVIGAGGANGSPGSAGGNTTFGGTLAIFRGGSGGGYGADGGGGRAPDSPAGSTYGGQGSDQASGLGIHSRFSVKGQPSLQFLGGTPATTSGSNTRDGGGGGAGPFGAGGNGATSAAANTGAGGGGGYSVTLAGGSGGSGRLIVAW